MKILGKLRYFISGLLLLAVGCASSGRNTALPDVQVVFPPPPEPARVQYLGGLRGPQDLPSRRSAFSDFVLGEKPPEFSLAKPNNAVLHGSRLFVGDTVVNTVFVMDLVTGESHPLLGDRAAGKIRQPNNIIVAEDGTLYVADKIRGAVLVYNPDESFRTAFGRPGEVHPVDVVLANGELYVLDIEDNEVEVWSAADGAFLRSFGGAGNAPGKFFMPTHIAADAVGNIYVTDTGNMRVQKLTPNGEPVLTIGRMGRSLGEFAWPKGMDVDGHGRVYVADTRFANVQIFNDEAALLLFFGGPGRDRGNLDLPAGVSLHPWPEKIPWLSEKLLPGFTPEYLIIAVNQEAPYFINFFAVARTEE